MTLLSICVAVASIQTPTPLEGDFETALGTLGLTTQSARFDPNLLRFYGGGEFRAPFFEANIENPWRTPFFMDGLRKELGAQSGRPSDALMSGGKLMGFGTRRTLIASPNEAIEAQAKTAGDLSRALAACQALGLVRGAVPPTTGVPQDVQSAASLVLRSVLNSVVYRRLAFSSLNVMDTYQFLSGSKLDDPDGEPLDRLIKTLRQVDLKYLCAGSHDVLLAAQTAQSWLGAVSPTANYRWEVDTVWGRVSLSGANDSMHPDRPTLLIIDTGGNDGYLNVPSNASAANWASIVIDTTGNDRYLSSPELEFKAIPAWEGRKANQWRPGPGGALMGVTALLDTSGDDVYRSHRPGLGSGRFGVGVVLDTEGRDAYDSYTDSQGFGMFGVGILEDGSGDDRYDGFTQVQGVGLVMGFGYLADRKGNDRYLANDQVIDFPSSQSAAHNVSMSQGAGNGRRADYSDGHSLAGGVGILYDQSGVDGYSCGIFGQGVGYWMGVGALWDTGPENDIYLGQWYAQGASAHFAVGYLEDEGGNDVYTAPMNMAQGAGHDFSTGFLLDRAGDDNHKAPNLSLGAGNANGIGVFVDFGGTDNYESTGVTLGKGAEAAKASYRARAICLGVFLDLGGQDTYPQSTPWAVNATRTANWTDQLPVASESQGGVFWDR